MKKITNDKISYFDTKISELITKLMSYWLYEQDIQTKDHPLTQMHSKRRNILGLLYEKDLTVSELAYYTNINIKNLHRYINVLEKDGYIKRKQSSKDKKVFILSASAKTKKMITEYQTTIFSLMANLVSGKWTEEELNKGTQSIEYICGLLDKLKVENPPFIFKTTTRLTFKTSTEDSTPVRTE